MRNLLIALTLTISIADAAPLPERLPVRCQPDVISQELSHFPSQEGVDEVLGWSDSYIAWIEIQMALDHVHTDYWQTRWEQAREARRPWFLLNLIRNSAKPDIARRAFLWRLRGMIGDDAFKYGDMPSVIPCTH